MPDAIDYAFTTTPDSGETRAVAPGVTWLRMPLPFKLDHINLWILEDRLASGEPAWTLVDTGLFNETSQEVWTGLLDGMLAERPVHRIIVTHFHPDHIGMCGWLCERTGAELWITQTEWLFARSMSLDTDPRTLADTVAFQRKAGGPLELMAQTQENGHRFPKLVSPVPTTYRRIRDGDTISIDGRAWQVIVGTGHAPEHACLYCSELGTMISGDQVLPRITPIVAVPPWQPDADPLGDFLASLEKLRALPAETYVLPSHGLPFYGLGARLDALTLHHEERLADLHEACTRPMTAMELSRHLFRRPLDLQNTGLALGETLAHAYVLMQQGKLVRETDADGIWRFRRP